MWELQLNRPVRKTRDKTRPAHLQNAADASIRGKSLQAIPIYFALL